MTLLYRVLDGSKAAVRALGQHAAGPSQDQALVVAHKDRFAEPVFQLLDRPADGASLGDQNPAGVRCGVSSAQT